MVRAYIVFADKSVAGFEAVDSEAAFALCDKISRPGPWREIAEPVPPHAAPDASCERCHDHTRPARELNLLGGTVARLCNPCAREWHRMASEDAIKAKALERELDLMVESHENFGIVASWQDKLSEIWRRNVRRAEDFLGEGKAVREGTKAEGSGTKGHHDA